MTLSSGDADQLILDLGAWTDGLPAELKFEGPSKSSSSSGFLHLLYVPVRFLVTRPFMRISFQLPERFANISVGIEQWSKMETEARESIEWVDQNESALEGWFVGLYSLFVCSLVQASRVLLSRRRGILTSCVAVSLSRPTTRCSITGDPPTSP